MIERSAQATRLGSSEPEIERTVVVHGERDRGAQPGTDRVVADLLERDDLLAPLR